MGNEPAACWLRRVVVAASWIAAASVGQGLFGTDIGRDARGLQERIELQIERQAAPREPAMMDEELRQRSHEEESIEPWELVAV